MASRARPRSRPRPARRAVPAAPRVTIERAALPRSQVLLGEDPHAHIVCRVCGRIQPIDLTQLDMHFLTRLAEDHPEGWSVDGISFSLTGACRRCREGPSA
jgi:Fe2+ or Zn2+ uptake regulation protein